jgi:uncharacterized protein YaaR (DUF327 family)
VHKIKKHAQGKTVRSKLKLLVEQLHLKEVENHQLHQRIKELEGVQSVQLVTPPTLKDLKFLHQQGGTHE